MCAIEEHLQVSSHDLNSENDTGLDRALERARVDAAAHSDAVLAIRDAQTLRLQVLMDEFVPVVETRKPTSDFIRPAIIAGDQPRMWIDLASYVVMAPDPRTFRLVQDTREGPQTVLETTDRAEMMSALTEFIAHRAVERQRALPGGPAPQPSLTGRYSLAALILAWTTGVSFGALGLFILASLTGMAGQ